MALLQQCDSCPESTPAPEDNPDRVPKGWTRVRVDRGTAYMLCPECRLMPMRFGNIDLRLDPPCKDPF